MNHPSAAPESLELQLLREMIAEFRELKREVVRMRSEFASVIDAQQQLGLAMGIPIVIARRGGPPTPPPTLRAVNESWAPPQDHGDRGTEER